MYSKLKTFWAYGGNRRKIYIILSLLVTGGIFYSTFYNGNSEVKRKRLLEYIDTVNKRNYEEKQNFEKKETNLFVEVKSELPTSYTPLKTTTISSTTESTSTISSTKSIVSSISSQNIIGKLFIEEKPNFKVKAKPIFFKGPRNQEQREIVKAFLHAWKAYEKYAWGLDELHPISHSGGIWFNCGLTILDSLDTMWIMGLKDEFNKSRNWVAESLKFNHPSVQLFEIVIRALGGLLSAYHLSGDDIFAIKAKDLGEKLFPCVRGGTIPCRFANLMTPKKYRMEDHSTAEVGSIQLEFRDLARVFGEVKYEEAVNKIMKKMSISEKFDGLASAGISTNGEFHHSASLSAGASVDSYYEYLLKMYLQGGKTENWLKQDYLAFYGGMTRNLLKFSKPNNLAFVGALNGFHGTFRSEMEHLACFLPGTIALGVLHAGMPKEHLDVAEKLTETCYRMYTSQPTKLSPEVVYVNMDIDSKVDFGQTYGASYNLQRPETVESIFYMYKATKNKKYREMAWNIFLAFEKHTKLKEGYASINTVYDSVNPSHRDKMETFYLAETLKYLYLLFDDDNELPLDRWVFNTEAHPLPTYHAQFWNNV